LLEVPAECGGAAGLDCPHDLQRRAGQRMSLAVRLAIGAKDISQFRTSLDSCRLMLMSKQHCREVRYSDGLLSGAESKSSRSCFDSSSWLLICR
jgi:hypothetical protein